MVMGREGVSLGCVVEGREGVHGVSQRRSLLRCCLRLRETTPVPLVQVPSLLAQCAPGVWSYQPQRARPCTTPSTALLSKDLELPVFIIPPCFASIWYH